ncbi:DNA cytosine methyltransferase [Georgenia sp. SUBG003]|uniref:DNA cytosine methyltransferase n=1 Tax=Georgenia sp. SUBG003 TaxID=1497974 RepID=UPI003AB8C5FE
MSPWPSPPPEPYLEHARLIEEDVQEISASDLRPSRVRRDWRPDILVGGPPCQPWSAGHQKGLNDPRGKLIAHYLRLIDEASPRLVLFENVRGLVTALGATGTPGEVLRSIQSDLADMGYASRVATLNAADYGAAQRRVRLLLMATREGRRSNAPRSPSRSVAPGHRSCPDRPTRGDRHLRPCRTGPGRRESECAQAAGTRGEISGLICLGSRVIGRRTACTHRF